MKRLIISMVIIFIIIFTSTVYGEELSNFTDASSQIKFEEIDDLLKNVMDENQITRKGTIKELALKIAKGEKILEGESIFDLIKSSFMAETRKNLGLLSKIIVVAIISSIITNLQRTFENSSISELANYVMFILIGILIIANFIEIMEMMKLSVDRMTNLMELLLPILLTLLIITSGPNARIMFHPMVLGLVNLVALLIKNVIFPLILFSFILSILSNLSNKLPLNKLSDLSRKIIIFIITASFTIFIGFLTIYGLANKVDGLTIRTAKFAVDKFIPIVGSFLSDAVDTVISSSAILKNGIGIVGLLLLVLIILAPIVKLTTILFIYNLIGALMEPIVSKNISKFFSDISKTLVILLVTMVSIGIMFFITITMIVDTGNNLLMLR